MDTHDWQKSGSLNKDWAVIINGPVGTLALSTVQAEILKPRTLSPGVSPIDVAIEQGRQQGWRECLAHLQKLADSPKPAPRPVEADFGANAFLAQDNPTTHKK